MLNTSKDLLRSLRSLQTAVNDDEDDDASHAFSAVLSNLLLFFLIFGLSATVDVKNMKRQLTNKFAIGCGVLMQFIIMPALGFLATLSLSNYGLTKGMGIALLVVTSSPGGSYSNWWCSLFNADLALSVAMTTVSSILSVGLLPGNLMLYTYLVYGVSEDESVLEALSFSTLFITLGIVLAAIVSGLATGVFFDSTECHKIANRFGSVCGVLLIVFSLFLSSGGDGSDSTFWNQPWAFYLGVAGPCILGMVLANILSRAVHLSHPETVAIAIECCYQNTGIATSVAITMFDDVEERAQAVAVPLFYGVVEAIAIGCYCVLAWKMGWTKAPADENICVMLGKTYEVEDEMEIDFNDGEGSEARDSFGRTNQQQARWGSFWDSVFFWRRSPDESMSTHEGGRHKLKTDQNEETQRNRFASADYTAETSQCSTPDTPPSRSQNTAYTIQALSIPESPDRENQLRDDDEYGATANQER